MNEAFARRYFNGTSALDHFITLPDIMVRPAPNEPMRIVGVVADAVYISLREPPRPTMYLPMAQRDEPFFTRALATVHLSVRARADSPARMARSLAAAIQTVSPRLTVTFRPLSDQLGDSLARERVLAIPAGFFGGLALLLAALGLYGVTAYAVARRHGEIAIRAALGATPARVLELMLSRLAVLLALGIVVGGVVSVYVTRLVASLLYGVQAHDATTFVGSGALLAVVGAVAGWFPAWRASRVDPAAILRDA